MSPTGTNAVVSQRSQSFDCMVEREKERIFVWVKRRRMITN